MFTLGTNCHCSIAGSTLQTKSTHYHLHLTRDSPHKIEIRSNEECLNCFVGSDIDQTTWRTYDEDEKSAERIVRETVPTYPVGLNRTVGYHIAFYGANLRHQLIFLTSPAAKWIPDRPTIQIRAENSLGKDI